MFANWDKAYITKNIQNQRRRKTGFTLTELILVICIITLLAAIIAPSLYIAKELAKRAYCMAHLNGLGRSMGSYHANNKESFWPGAKPNYPEPGVITYFWGTNTDPVDTRHSPFLKYCDYSLEQFWCPSMKWGTYKPQGNVKQHTTTLAYNTWCLDPASYMWKWDLRPKRSIYLPQPASLFVFVDAAMAWNPFGEDWFQNSTHLEPITGPPAVMPTTHFRHLNKTNALCADGHAEYYGLEGGKMYDIENNLGFVGTNNIPHYDVPNN